MSLVSGNCRKSIWVLGRSGRKVRFSFSSFKKKFLVVVLEGMFVPLPILDAFDPEYLIFLSFCIGFLGAKLLYLIVTSQVKQGRQIK